MFFSKSRSKADVILWWLLLVPTSRSSLTTSNWMSGLPFWRAPTWVESLPWCDRQPCWLYWLRWGVEYRPYICPSAPSTEYSPGLATDSILSLSIFGQKILQLSKIGLNWEPTWKNKKLFRPTRVWRNVKVDFILSQCYVFVKTSTSTIRWINQVLLMKGSVVFPLSSNLDHEDFSSDQRRIFWRETVNESNVEYSDQTWGTIGDRAKQF